MPSLTRAALQSPRLAVALLVALTLLLSAGLPRLETDVGYRAFLGAEHPVVRDFDAFLARFGGGLPVAVAWACEGDAPCRSVFDPVSLRMAERVARGLEAAPGVAGVQGPGTSPLLLPNEEGFAIRHFVVSGEVAADREALEKRARVDPLWTGTLVSADGRVGAILLELASSHGTDSIRVFEVLERALAPWRAEGFDFHLVGGPVDFVFAAAELREANARLVPLVAVAVSGVVWLLFRSLLGVAFTLGTMGVAVLWTLGLQGWLGWEQNTITQTLAPLVLVVGSCNGIHLLARYAAETEVSGGDTASLRARALERCAGDVGAPCSVASLTTAAGFASFATSGLESFVRFGAIAAAGVLFALLLAFTLLPLLLVRLPSQSLPQPSTTHAWDRALDRLVGFADRRRTAILALSGAATLVCAFGATRLAVDVRFEDLYGEQSRIVQSVRFLEQHLRRPETIEIELALPAGERAVTPAAVAKIAELASFLPTLPGLGPVHSVLEPLAWAHRLVRDDDPTFQRPGDTRRQNAQLLALLTLDDPHSLAPWLTLDQNRVRVSAESSKVPQDVLRSTMAAIEDWLSSQLPPGWSATLTGAGAVIRALVDEVQRTQLTSFATAAIVVVILVGAFLRSLRHALLAMIPTGLPVVLTLGTMGLLGIALDIGTSMVAAVVIGIAIDDTVHLLSQYRRRRERGQDAAHAIREAVPHVGRALITTSVALALGFLALVTSPWGSIASFGVVAAIAILAALAADLLVLPALLLSATRRRESHA